MTDVQFAPMEEGDLAWVAAQEQDIYPFPWSFANFRDAQDAGYSSWVMRSGGQALGYALLMLVLDEAHLLNISVVRSKQGQGWGHHLMEHVKQQARQYGAQVMFLEVRPSNTLALGFYERRGFEQIGRRKGYYPDHEGREDALVMRCAL